MTNILFLGKVLEQEVATELQAILGCDHIGIFDLKLPLFIFGLYGHDQTQTSAEWYCPALLS